MPYLNQLDRTCRRQTWQRTIVGCCWVMVTIILVASVLIICDRIIGFRWPVLRLLATATLLSSGVWAIKYLLIGLPKILPLHVALQLEEFYPELGDRLASAVQFSKLKEFENRSDHSLAVTHGSAALRRAVELRVAHEVEEVDWDLLLSKHQRRRALLVLGMVVLLIGSVAVFVPQTLQIGVARLFHPLGQDQWPRRVELQLVDALQFVVAGNEFEVRVRNLRGKLPADVWIHYRPLLSTNLKTSHLRQETVEPMFHTDQAMMVRKLIATSPLEYRVTGGDDRDMPWHSVEVVAQPRMDLLQVKVRPPEYTGRPKMILVPLSQNQSYSNYAYRILAGSRLEVMGKSSVPLAGIRLQKQQPEQSKRKISHKEREISSSRRNSTESQEFTIKGELDDDDRSFRLGSLQAESHAWDIHESGQYRLELTTQGGWTTCAQRSLWLEIVADMPPHVEWIEPVDDLTVVAEAQVKLIVRATDDHGLRDVAFTCQLDETEVVQEEDLQVLFPQSDHAPVSTSQEQTTVVELPTTLDLAGRGYQSGQTLLVQAQARDFFTHAGKRASQIGQTIRPLRLHVISQTALLNTVQQRQTLLVKRLTSALETQQKVHRRLLTEKLPFVEARSESDLTGLLIWQRQVAHWLDSPNELRQPRGAVQLVEELLLMLNQNQLVDTESDRLLDWLQSNLIDLARSVLPGIETSLHYLLLSMSSAPADDVKHSSEHHASVPPSYITRRAEILQKQETVIGHLQHLLRELTHWDKLQQLTYQLQQLEQDQRLLIRQGRLEWDRQGLASQVGTDPSTVELERSRLSSSQQTTLWDQMIAKERQLAQRTGQLITQLESVADSRNQASPEAARRISALAQTARRYTIQATLQAAADQLSQHRLDRALAIEQQALEQLQSLSEQLASNRPHHPAQESSPQLQQSAKRNFNSENQQPGDSHSSDLTGSTPASHASGFAKSQSTTPMQPESIGALVDNLWGALPERERQQIVQPVGAEFIPQYASEIGAYFQALATPPTVGSPRKFQRSDP